MYSLFDGWFCKDDDSLIDMQEMKEDAVDFLQNDARFECDKIVDCSEEENSDCCIWKDDILESDVLDMVIKEESIDVSAKDKWKGEEDIVDFFLIYASKLNFSGSCKK